MYKFMTTPLFEIDSSGGADGKIRLVVHALTVAVRALIAVPILAVRAIYRGAVATRGARAVWKRVAHFLLVFLCCFCNLLVFAASCFSLLAAVCLISSIPDSVIVCIPITVFTLISVLLTIATIRLFEIVFGSEEEKEHDYKETVQEPVAEPCSTTEPPSTKVDELDFCQLFDIASDMVVFLDHVEMCPDETAFIRVVNDEGYTPLYKRRVQHTKDGRRFIRFDSKQLFLDPDKTKPIIPKKED